MGDEGGGGGGEGQDIPTAVSFLVVAGLSGYNAFGSIIVGGVPCCYPPLSFSTIVTPKTACGIIFINSLVGLWKYGIPVAEEQAKKAYKYTSYLQDYFVLPIVVSAAIIKGGYMKELAYANMLVPVIPLLAKALDQEDYVKGSEDGIVATECAALGIISALEEDYVGVATALLFAAYHFLAKREKISCVDVPNQIKMNFFMGCFAACIQKGLIIKPLLPVRKAWSLFPKKETCTGNCPQCPLKIH